MGSASLLSENLGVMGDYQTVCIGSPFDGHGSEMLLPLSLQEMTPKPHQLDLVTNFRTLNSAPNGHFL
jgi:hypothetical protein